MSWLPESQDRLPLTWWKGQPIYLAAVLALLGVVSMVVTALLMATAGGILARLIFSYASVLDHLWLWTPVTYVLVNPPSLWLLLSSYFFWRFGEEVERHLGRRSFVKLVVGLMLVSPLLLTVIAFTGARDWQAIGIMELEFGVFLAFATLYPHAKLSIIILTLDAWIFAAALVGVSALTDLANRNWPGLFLLAGQALFAFGYIRYEQGRWTLPSLRLLKPKPRLRALGSGDLPPARGSSGKSALSSEDLVNAILEKIHREGMQSLTAEERRIMQQESDSLRKRGS